MPYTPRQTRYLLSSGSPLSGAQKSKMKGELHDDPALAHARKGFHKTGALGSLRRPMTKRRTR